MFGYKKSVIFWNLIVLIIFGSLMMINTPFFYLILILMNSFAVGFFLILVTDGQDNNLFDLKNHIWPFFTIPGLIALLVMGYMKLLPYIKKFNNKIDNL